MNANTHVTKQVFNEIVTDSQVDDVHKTVHRFYVQDRKGMLFTNSTGTGKTHLGCSIVDVINEIDKRKVLIVAPSNQILTDWKVSLSQHGYVASITTPSEFMPNHDIHLMTYASFRQCASLLNITFDLIIFDESHYLMMSNKGDRTNAFNMMRAITGHQDGEYSRQLLDKSESDIEIQSSVKCHKLARETTKVLLLSATPFASHKCIDYAEGLIFEYGEEPTSRGYNTPSAKEQFFIDHFGYSIRCGRLVRPDVEVDTGLLERKFHELLMSQGGLSHRDLSLDTDYSRQFISVDSAIGSRIDEGLRLLREDEYKWLRINDAGILKHVRQKQLLESIKARSSIDRVKQHLALGRKVVVYHSFHKCDIRLPFDFENEIEAIECPLARSSARSAYSKFKQRYPDLVELSLDKLIPTVELYKEVFGDCVGLFNGRVPKKKRNKTIEEFNKKDSGLDVLVVQERAGREGISLHDTEGDSQRVLIQLGMPSDAVACIQIEGRIRRFRAASNAIYEYFNTGTNFEISTFAHAVAERSEVVENLACGNRARNLKSSFIYGYLNSTDEAPSLSQGTGGIDEDFSDNQTSVWDQARSRFFSTMKKSSRTKSAEGEDFYSTPAPAGLFMSMLARPKPGESMLEPSVGQGDIAMWCPNSVKLTCIEKSYGLYQKIQLRINRRASFRHMPFEDYCIGTKHQVILMNPPFGRGGKLAADHLKKACNHLKPLGRVVALIPESEQMETRVEKMLEALRNEQIFIKVHSEFSLPSITFKRAGTLTKTKIVMLVRSQESYSRIMDIETKYEDFSHLNEFDDLFTALEEYAETNIPKQQVSFGEPMQLIQPQIDLSTLPIVISNKPMDNVIPLNANDVGTIQDTECIYIDENNQYRLFG